MRMCVHVARGYPRSTSLNAGVDFGATRRPRDWRPVGVRLEWLVKHRRSTYGLAALRRGPVEDVRG